MNPHHDLQTQTFVGPTYCQITKAFLWGLSNQGVACSRCGLVCAHGLAAEQLGPCKPKAPPAAASLQPGPQQTVLHMLTRQLCVVLIDPAVESQRIATNYDKVGLSVASQVKEKFGTGRFMVFNLCRRFSAEAEDAFESMVQQSPEYYSMGTSPNLPVLITLTDTISSWVRADSGNVAIVFSSKGKIRLDLVLASYLVVCGRASTSDEALGMLYGDIAVPTASGTGVDYLKPFNAPALEGSDNNAACVNGIRPQSAILDRYLGYMCTVVHQGMHASSLMPMSGSAGPCGSTSIMLSLKTVCLRTCPQFDTSSGGCRPRVTISQGKTTIFDSCKPTSADVAIPPALFTPSDPEIVLNADNSTPLSGDYFLKCSHCEERSKGDSEQQPTEVCMFRFGFHTSFVLTPAQQNSDQPVTVILAVSDLDVADQHRSRFWNDFRFELLFERVPQDGSSDASDAVPLAAAEGSELPASPNLASNSKPELWLWLKGLGNMGLEQYYSVLKANGYDDIDLCATLEEEDLVRLGVVLAGHRRRLLVAVGELDDHNEPVGIHQPDDVLAASEEPAVSAEPAVSPPPSLQQHVQHASEEPTGEQCTSSHDSDDEAFLKELDAMSDGGLSIGDASGSDDDLLAELDREFE